MRAVDRDGVAAFLLVCVSVSVSVSVRACVCCCCHVTAVEKGTHHEQPNPKPSLCEGRWVVGTGGGRWSGRKEGSYEL